MKYFPERPLNRWLLWLNAHILLLRVKSYILIAKNYHLVLRVVPNGHGDFIHKKQGKKANGSYYYHYYEMMMMMKWKEHLLLRNFYYSFVYGS